VNVSKVNRCCRVFFLSLILCYANITLTGEEQTRAQSEAQLIDQAQNLINTGQLDSAQNMVQAAIRKYPRSGGLYNLLGIIAAEQNRNQDAESAFLTATRYAPSLLSALLNLARVYYSEGKDDAAILTYRRALKINNNLPEANANLAALLLDKGNYAEAQSRLALLPAEDREQNRFRAMECAAFAGVQNFDRAKEAARQLTGTVTEQDVSLPAYVLTKLDQSELVIDLLQRVDIENSSKELRGLLGAAYAKSGNPARARTLFESVAREEPKDVRPLTDAAHVAYQERDYEGAAGYLAHALKVEPENANVQFFFGIVCVHLNLPGDALQALKEAVRLKPDNPSFNYALGAATLSGENKADAISLFRKYVQLRPADLHGKLALGVAEFEAGNADAARRDLKPLVQEKPVAVGAHYILGKICRQENDLSSAASHFENAIKLNPDDASLQANLAVVYIRQRRDAEARQTLDRALALDPDNYLANENLLLLLRKEKNPSAEEQARRFSALTRKVSEDQQLLFRHINAN
jgi:Flp pilus assembly protein TadD